MPVSTRYSYDGQQIIADYNGGVLLRKYIYGPGIDEPICMINVSDNNAVYYYHFDGLESVVALSNSSANIIEKYKYDVFGKPTIREPGDEPWATSSVNNRYMFTGREYDSETGLYYYRARYYNSTLGRFLQPDLILYVNGYNLYTYAMNNSIKFTDPDGKICCSECQTNYNNQVRGLWGDTANCIAGCGLVMTPGEALCLISCSLTGPFAPACVAACLGAGGAAFVICAGACLNEYDARREAINMAHERCMRGCD